MYTRFWKLPSHVLLLASGIWMGSALAASSAVVDKELLRSLVAKDMEGARAALEKGANPEAVLGQDLVDHAMCAAIDDSGSRFLELLVEYGASPNAYFDFDVGYPNHRTPLACSVYLWNFDAFDYLLLHGADPAVDLYKESSEKYRNWQTAFVTALTGRRFPMALRLVQLYELHPAELQQLVTSLEKFPYNEAHPWNYARDALIEWTQERVADFNPMPAHPSPDGVGKECLFTFRDQEQGLKKGTLCPRPEDLR